MDSSEKEGGCTRPAKQMEAFCDAINTCNLRDMGYLGQDFTWSRRLGSRGWVRERLDRALVSTNWAARFPKMHLHHKPNSSSDHCILILKDIQQKRKGGCRKKMFRFEEMWLKDEACVGVIEEAWDRGLHMGPIAPLSSCLEECRRSLSAWNNNSFGHVGKKLAMLQARLEGWEGMGGASVTLKEIECTRTEINTLLDSEEIMWRQRSRISWLKHGDKNTSFFHTKASSRYNRNTIQGVMDNSGIWQSEDEGIENSFVDYFGSLFTTSNPMVSEELIQAIQGKVTEPMNALLTRDFQATKVDSALKHMYPTSAPGPNGMPPIFYQKFWSKVRPVVVKSVLDFLNLGIIPLHFKETHIVLIPKVKEPQRVTDFRPISLCNVVYKLASKSIANRLKQILPKLVCENQSAFVAERLITDNVLVASEIMYHISQRRKGKVGEMALKLDMSKAYDRVEWGCLERIMLKMGFAEKWVALVMKCICSVSYAIKINGIPRGHIIPSRGLR